MASSLERAANYLDRQMVEPLRQALIARRLFQKVYTLPAGKWNVDVDRISDMNEAQIAYGMPSEEGSRDAINITRENFRLPFLWKDYEIVRSDLEAFASEGINIESASMLNAARKLAEHSVAERAEQYPEATMFGTLPAYGFYCRHVRGLRLQNVRLQTAEEDGRHAIACDDVSGLTISGLEASGPAAGPDPT